MPMDWSRQCAAVVPCLNEAATVGKVVRGLREHVKAVWVVDDGSADATWQEAEAAGARVIRHPANRGKGAALRTGLRAAAAAGCGWALTVDGDGQHDPAEVPAFFRVAEEERADLVIGHRMAAAVAMPWVRRRVNAWMSRRLSARAGFPCPDSQCGFRLVHLPAWTACRLETDHFEVESEVLLAFARAGRRIRFVPVRSLPAGRPSRIQPSADTLRWLRWWWKAGSARGQGSCPNDHQAPSPNPPSQRQSWLRRGAIQAARLTVAGLFLGWFYAWAAPLAYPQAAPLGFGHGMLHGALMPMALPSLVLGQDVEIFAPNHNGRPYKLGYIVGINACGLVFFGIGFGRPGTVRTASSGRCGSPPDGRPPSSD